MPLHTASTIVPWTPRLTVNPLRAALDLLGPVDGLHVLVIGRRSLRPMLELHRRGAAGVSAIAATTRIRPDRADAALIPCLDNPDHVQPAIAIARHAIRPLNTLVLVVPADAPASLAAHASQTLAEHGFSTGRPVSLPDGTALVANLPLYGRLRVA